MRLKITYYTLKTAFVKQFASCIDSRNTVLRIKQLYSCIYVILVSTLRL